MHLLIVLFILMVCCTLTNGSIFRSNLTDMKNSFLSHFEMIMKDLKERTKLDMEDSTISEAVPTKKALQIKKEGLNLIANPQSTPKMKIDNEKKINTKDSPVRNDVKLKVSKNEALHSTPDPKLMKEEKKIESSLLSTTQFMAFTSTAFNAFTVLLFSIAISISIIYLRGRTLSHQNQRNIVYQALSVVEGPFNIQSLVKSLDSALLILRLARTVDSKLDTPEINDFYEYLKEVERNGSLIRQGFGGLKVLSIEGLEGCGKTTLIEGLVAKTGATTMDSWKYTSTEVQQQFLKAEVPEVVATALAFVLNYCTAYQIITETVQTGTEKIIIMEQFHHSLCANTVASNAPLDIQLRTLPAAVFEWPADLPRPTLVVFLFLQCSERSNRIKQNNQHSPSKMNNEKVLKNNLEGYDDRIATVYSLITGPPTIVLDASTSREEVLTIALEACEEFDVYKPPLIAKKRVKNRVSVGFYDGLARF